MFRNDSRFTIRYSLFLMILIILGAAAFLAVMLWTILLPVKPDSLKIFGRLVCRPDEKMEILTSHASYHQPGENSIEIYCNKYGNRRLVNGKTFLFAFIFSFVVMLPVAAAIVIAIDRFVLN